MTPRIETAQERKLIGMKLSMSLAHDRTRELWSSFMPLRASVNHQASADLFSVQMYDTNYFRQFDPEAVFEKWAALEVLEFENVPREMDTMVLAGGEYAVFDYKGLAGDSRIFQYIYSEWLPGSGYQLDNRPHFEILGENFRVNDPGSEEQIWIPVTQH
jgi:AraC family transcriptional regulator